MKNQCHFCILTLASAHLFANKLSILDCPAFSTPAYWSRIFQSRIFHPYILVPHFPVLHFPPLYFWPSRIVSRPLKNTNRKQWRSQGGTLVHVTPVVIRVKNFKSSIFGSVTIGYERPLWIQYMSPASGGKAPKPNVYSRNPWGEYSPQKFPPKKPIKFFLYLGLELSSVKKANNKTVV